MANEQLPQIPTNISNELRDYLQALQYVIEMALQDLDDRVTVLEP